MADVKWIKIKVGMFDGDSFKKIKRAKIGGIAFRDNLTAVWFELLDLAGKGNNNGLLVDSNEMPFISYEQIAIMIDRADKEVELCMQFFIAEKMIEIIDDMFCLTNFIKYQQIDGLDKIREQTKNRVANCRERKKELLCNATVTQSSISISNVLSSSISNSNIEDINSIIEYLNLKAKKSFKVVESNAKFIKARLKDYSIEDIKSVIDKKCSAWIGTDWEKYLRPETLFNATKFESYFNEEVKQKTNENKKIEDGRWKL